MNLRKLFLAINAANQDTLLGAHTIVSERPKDPNVHVLLFSTGSHTDRRIDAQDRIESYVVASNEAPFWLWGRQLAGQRAIQALAQTRNQKDPEPGQIFVLRDLANDTEQYVRVTSVEMAEQTFTKDRGSYGYYNYQLKTYVIELAQPLSFDFEGSDPDPTGNLNRDMKILQTQVADAAKYFGASPLAAPASVGDRTIVVEDVFAPLVPSAQSENAITDQAAGAQATIIRPASNDLITISNISGVSTDANGAGIYYAGRAIVPGTLRITGTNGEYEDRGGRLVHTGGSNYIDEENSVVDYANGEIRAFYSGGSASPEHNSDLSAWGGCESADQAGQPGSESADPEPDVGIPDSAQGRRGHPDRRIPSAGELVPDPRRRRRRAFRRRHRHRGLRHGNREFHAGGPAGCRYRNHHRVG